MVSDGIPLITAAKQAALDNIIKIAAKLSASSGSRQGKETVNRVAGTKVKEGYAVLVPTF